MGKKKKEKVVYVDDGRTLADMSGVRGGLGLHSSKPGRLRPDPKDVWNTYWNAVKMMFTPMLVVICGLIIIYMVLSLIFLIA